MTSNDLKETRESVKSNRKIKLKGGNPNDDTSQARGLFEQDLYSK